MKRKLHDCLVIMGCIMVILLSLGCMIGMDALRLKLCLWLLGK